MHEMLQILYFPKMRYVCWMLMEHKFHVLRPKKFSFEPKHMYTETATMNYANETIPLQCVPISLAAFRIAKTRKTVQKKLAFDWSGKMVFGPFFSSIFAFDATFNAIFS